MLLGLVLSSGVRGELTKRGDEWTARLHLRLLRRPFVVIELQLVGLDLLSIHDILD